MKLFKTLLTILFISLLSSPSWSMDYFDLIERNDLYYEKFSDVPFTGKVTGLAQGSFKNGQQEGVWVWYLPNGQLWGKGLFKNGQEEGAWVYYWSKGQLWLKGNYKNGKKEGAWVSYNEDGIVDKERTGTYKNGVKISD